MATPFDETKIPDLTGYVIIVTGGNSGIGLETTKHLALHNARVYIASRSHERVQKAINDLRAATTQKLDLRFLQVDLLDLSSVKAAAVKFNSQEERLDILINNAGIMHTPYALSKDGFEHQWQSNYLAPHVLTSSLLSTLLWTAAGQADKNRVRVVNVTSDLAFRGPKEINFDDVNLSHRTGMLGPYARYSHAKQATIRDAYEFNNRYAEQGVHSFSIHPGVAASNLQQHNPTVLGKVTSVLTRFSPMTILQATHNSLFAATSPDATRAAGQGNFYEPVGKLGTKADKWFEETDVNKKLWEMSEEITSRVQ